MFKPNSRFSALMEDDDTATVSSVATKKTTTNASVTSAEPSRQRENTFKCAIPYRPAHYRYSEQELAHIREVLDAESNAQKARQKAEYDRRIQEGLRPEYFQPLVDTLIDKHAPVIDYGMLTMDAPLEELEDPNALRKGWTRISRHPVTRQVVFETAPPVAKVIAPVTKPPEEMDLACQLIHLYYKRSNEYLRLNGYEAWEKNYKFPGWRQFYAEFDEKCKDPNEEKPDNTNDEDSEYNSE